MDVNIIGVDWLQFQLRQGQQNLSVYDCSKLFATVVGNFLNDMVESHGMNFSDVTMVGHSIASRFCRDITGNLKGRIKSFMGLESCVVSHDMADFVQVIV